MFILSAPAPPEKGTGWAVRAWCCRPLAYASGGLWPTFAHQMARPAAKVGGWSLVPVYSMAKEWWILP